MSNACPSKTPPFVPQDVPRTRQAILVTGPRGALAPPPPRRLVDGNTSAHVIRKQKPVGKGWKQEEGQPHCSCSKSSSTSHHWKLLLSRESGATTAAQS